MTTTYEPIGEGLERAVSAAMASGPGPSAEVIEGRMLATGATISQMQRIPLYDGLRHVAGIFERVQHRWEPGRQRDQARAHARAARGLGVLLKVGTELAERTGGPLAEALETIAAEANPAERVPGMNWADEERRLVLVARARRARLLARHVAEQASAAVGGPS